MALEDKWTFTEQSASILPFGLFEKLRHRKKLLDFRISSKDGREVRANRFLLAMRFPRISDNVTAEDRALMEWKRFNADIVEAAVTFAYTGRVEITMTNVANLFLLSINLGCSTLTSGCIEFLRPRLSEDNVETFWFIANATMNSDLMGICVPVIADNFDGFTARPQFHMSTAAEYLASMLKDDRLNHVPEDAKLGAIAKWVEVATTEEGEECQIDCLKNLVESIDLKRVSLEVCVKFCSSNVMMNFPEECRQLIFDEWMVAKKSSRLAARETFKDYVIAYETPSNSPQMLSFRSIFKEDPGVNFNFHMESRQNCAVIFFNDNIYLIGGMEKVNNGYALNPSNKVDRVNPFTGSPSTVSPMTLPRSGHCAAAGDRYLFVIGGDCNTSDAVTCETFSPIQNSWTRLPNTITKRTDTAAVNVPGVGLVVVGGWQGHINRKVDFVELLTPRTEDDDDWSWQTLAPMLQWRRSPTVAYFRGCVIVAGGNDGNQITVECLPMTPVCRNYGQWTQLAGVSHNRSGTISLAAFNGRLLFYNSDTGLELQQTSCISISTFYGKGEVVEFLPDSESEDSELKEFKWKPLFAIAQSGNKRLLVLRRRL